MTPAPQQRVSLHHPIPDPGDGFPARHTPEQFARQVGVARQIGTGARPDVPGRGAPGLGRTQHSKYHERAVAEEQRGARQGPSRRMAGAAWTSLGAHLRSRQEFADAWRDVEAVELDVGHQCVMREASPCRISSRSGVAPSEVRLAAIFALPTPAQARQSHWRPTDLVRPRVQSEGF